MREPPATDPAAPDPPEEPSARLRLLRAMGAGAAGALPAFLAACGPGEADCAASGTASPPSAARSDVAADLALLGSALTLEHVEADFYAKVIDSGLIKDKATAELAKRFGASEQEHLDALTALVTGLGGTPARAPQTTFDDVLGGGRKRILATAATVENAGAAAYLGAAGTVKSKEILAAVLTIHSVEARQAATLNILAGRGFGGTGGLKGAFPDGAFGKPLGMEVALAAVEPFLA